MRSCKVLVLCLKIVNSSSCWSEYRQPDYGVPTLRGAPDSLPTLWYNRAIKFYDIIDGLDGLLSPYLDLVSPAHIYVMLIFQFDRLTGDVLYGPVLMPLCGKL